MSSELLKTPSILLVEDNDDHAVLVQRNVPAGAKFKHLLYASEASEWLQTAFRTPQGEQTGDSPFVPDLIFLDWKFEDQDMQGRDVLKCLKTYQNSIDLNIHRLPVVVLTTSDEPRDISEAFDSYANSYLVKPKHGGIAEWANLLKDALHYWHQLDHHELAKPGLSAPATN